MVSFSVNICCLAERPELAKQVLAAQQVPPSKNDWCLQVNEDLKECKINLS